MSLCRVSRWVRAAGLAALLALILPLTAWSTDPRLQIGVVERLQGEAEAVFGDEVRALAVQAPVYLDDKLVTRAGARMLLRLADDTESKMGQNATLVVDNYVYDPAKAKGAIIVNALAGAFLFKGGKIEQQENAEAKIVTTVATLGIRGTTVWGGEIDGQYGVLVSDGEVTVTNEGGTVHLTTGLGTSISGPDAAPGPAKRWPSEKVARAIATVEFAP